MLQVNKYDVLCTVISKRQYALNSQVNFVIIIMIILFFIFHSTLLLTYDLPQLYPATVVYKVFLVVEFYWVSSI